METKVCFKCGVEKPLDNYYKHPAMGDGHLNKCKECTKSDSKKTFDTKKKDPEWVEAEKTRSREKYYRLGYKDIHKPTPEKKKEAVKRYIDKYPEKRMAIQYSQHTPKEKGTHNHHWSYNEPHWKDVINLTIELHAKLHRYLVYDQERKMYRRIDTNELLDTRESHEAYIELIKTKP